MFTSPKGYTPALVSSLQALERVVNGELRDLAGQPDAFTEGFWYDEQGRQIRHVSFEGVVMQSVYDDTPAGRGRLVEKRYFPTVAAFADGHGSAAQVETYSFDVLGRQISTTRFTPHPLGQAPGHTETLTSVYDSRGRLASESTTSSLHPHAASRIGYEYDLLGRKIRTYTGTAAAPITDIRYSYNVLGQLFTVETLTRDGLPVDVKPDLNNPGNQPEITKHYYDLLGRLSRQELPNDVITGYTYDPGTDQIDQLTHYRSDGNNIDLTDNPKKAQFDYTTRADGKKTRSVETFWFDHDQNPATPDMPRSATYDWIYDDVGRLTSERIDHWDNLLDRTEAFTMDLFGNRVERTLDKGNDGTIEERTTYTYDANDRLLEEILDDLTSVNSPLPPGEGQGEGLRANTTYTWDHTQQTSKTSVTSASSVVQTFSYNLQGRLAAVTSETSDSNNTVTGRTQVEYTYDARGIRIRASDYVSDLQTSDFTLQTSTEYLVDHHNFTGYAQTVEERIHDAAGNLVKQITYTFGFDELVQSTIEYDPTSGLPSPASRLVFGHDALTNVRVLFEAAATIAQAYTFAAYGQLLAVHNSLGTSTLSNFELLTSHLSDGEYFDTRIGQTYLRARWYEPNAARFSRLDPFAGNFSDPLSLNKYLFVHGDAIQGIDPTGMNFNTVSFGAFANAVGRFATNHTLIFFVANPIKVAASRGVLAFLTSLGLRYYGNHYIPPLIRELIQLRDDAAANQLPNLADRAALASEALQIGLLAQKIADFHVHFEISNAQRPALSILVGPLFGFTNLAILSNELSSHLKEAEERTSEILSMISGKNVETDFSEASFAWRFLLGPFDDQFSPARDVASVRKLLGHFENAPLEDIHIVIETKKLYDSLQRFASVKVDGVPL